MRLRVGPSRWGALSAAFLVVAALLAHCMAATRNPRPDRELRKLAGCRVRVVWCQDLGNGEDLYAEGRQLRLMGFDSDSADGERPILDRPWSYARPMITPRGDRVIFSSRADDTVYIVNWDGSGLRGLVEGFGLDVWMDPSDGREWLYYAPDARPTTRQDEPKYSSVVRCPIDDPAHVELVWNLLPITQLSENNFQISADGRRASQHGPDICVVNELPNRKWTRYGKGCWPSIAPDNSYRFWHFNGNHRSITMYDPGPTNPRAIELNTAAELNGHEVFHPRWGNHPRFMAFTGPKRTKGGGAAMEVYVGRFDSAYSNLEQSVRITHNSFADLCPDVWVESAAATNWPPPNTPEEEATSEVALGLTWPTDQRGLAYLWANRAAANELPEDEFGASRICRVLPRGKAWFGRFFEMMPHGGWFEADGFPTGFTAKVEGVGAFTLECVLCDETPTTEILVPFFTMRQETAPQTNVLLGVKHGKILLRVLRRSPALETAEFVLADVPRSPTHFAVSFDRTSLVAFVGGTRVLALPLPEGDLPWGVGQIIFGDPAGQWRGRLESVAIYARRVYASEFAANAELVKQAMAQRRSVPHSRVRARVVQTTKIPPPESISPYRSAMVAHAYELVETLDGKSPPRHFQAARLAILDLEPQSEAARHEGEEHILEIERFDDHPELAGERLVSDLEDVTLPLYYEVDR